jgi:hypothetical protein
MRASDHRRDETVAVLRAGALDGCLTLDTFAERVAAANAAASVSELDALVEDLPRSEGRRLGRLLRRRRTRAVEVKVTPQAPTVTVGRARECDVVVGEQTVSGVHAELRHRAGRWFVRDLGSASGTWLNGRRLRREAPVVRGDVLRLGALRLDLRL